MSHKTDAGPGRTPPPPEHRFLKGTSGNKHGRPKGAVSLKKITRKVALKKHAVIVDGRIVRKTLLELVIEALISRAATGAPSMAALQNELRAKIRPTGEKQPGGLMVVPEVLSRENRWLRLKHTMRQLEIPQLTSTISPRNSAKPSAAFRQLWARAILASHRRWD